MEIGTKRGDGTGCANAPDNSNKLRFDVYQSPNGAERVRAYQGHTVPATRPAAHGNPALKKFLPRGANIQAASEIANE